MIYTVTLNPSLDYVVRVPDFRIGRTNRADREEIFPGGKGINVSIVLRNLGIPSAALGFQGGFTGRELCRRLEELGIDARLIAVPGAVSRINWKLQNLEGTEINGIGPAIPAEQTRQLLEGMDSLGRGDVLVLAGSVPPSMPSDIYQRLLERVRDREILTVVDAAGEILTGALALRPFLVKPNHRELGELFGIELTTPAQVIPYAKKLLERGARNVLVSLAGAGAVLAAEDGRVLTARAPAGELVNGVGAGDAMVAGFLTGWFARRDWTHAFRMGVAAGSATAFAPHLADRAHILALYEAVEVTAVE